jgi:cytosine/adenosine deaminase-related metal-dependent hydrolase
MEMATINGARSLGLEDQIGSLEAGKRADIVVHSYCRPEWRPGLDVMNSLIYSAQSTAVDTVVVDGRIILEGGRFTQLDEEAEYAQIDRAARALYERMDFGPQSRWPVL